MGLFDRSKKEKMPTSKEIAGSVETIQKLLDADIADIWKIDDRNSFLIAMSGWLNRKCSYGEDISALTLAEKTVYIVDTFQAEVSNGGSEQYLYNSSGAFAGEVIPSLSAIGATRTAEIYKEAFEAIPHGSLSDDGQHNELLDKLLTEDISEVLRACDQQFYEYPDDLEELLYSFILDNKGAFV